MNAPYSSIISSYEDALNAPLREHPVSAHSYRFLATRLSAHRDRQHVN